MKKSTSAFTIIELITVIVILSILVAITIVSYKGVQARARDSDRRADVTNIAKALEQYYGDNGTYPGVSGTWYISNNANWSTFSSSIATIIDDVPKDPVNTGNPTTANTYGYAYYTGAACGRTAGQWYLLVYRFEGSSNERFTDGTCATNELGDTYFAGGASYYRSVK